MTIASIPKANIYSPHYATQFATTVREEYQSMGFFDTSMFHTKTGVRTTFRFFKQGIAYSEDYVPNSHTSSGGVSKDYVDVSVQPYVCNIQMDFVGLSEITYDDESGMVDSVKHALARRKDAIILEAITSTQTSLVVPKDISNANAPLTMAALKRTSQLMTRNNIPKEGRVIICHSDQKLNLLNDPQVTSSDYNSVKALTMGDIKSYMGFEFIDITDFEATKGISAGIPVVNDTTYCYAFSKSSIGKTSCPIAVAINSELDIKIDRRPDLNQSTQIWGIINMGAKIIDEKGIVKIECQPVID
jgi:hypothetical protein